MGVRSSASSAAPNIASPAPMPPRQSANLVSPSAIIMSSLVEMDWMYGAYRSEECGTEEDDGRWIFLFLKITGSTTSPHCTQRDATNSSSPVPFSKSMQNSATTSPQQRGQVVPKSAREQTWVSPAAVSALRVNSVSIFPPYRCPMIVKCMSNV